MSWQKKADERKAGYDIRRYEEKNFNVLLQYRPTGP